VPANKYWTVKFTAPASQTSINSSNIYVIDALGNIVPTEPLLVGTDSKSVAVISKDNYVPGKSYYLYVSPNIRSIYGNFLNEGVLMKFSIKESLE
jgi:hypothetical protein